ncbi:MAG: PD40 domain-containing protein, partial [Actinobacteria bacterium]|nr:PD40 domain-containing protein [Actinomycetota bacterium]
NRPVWSPDGRRIAFGKAAGSGSSIYIMNADGSDQHPLETPDGGRISHPHSWDWRPDGQRLVVGSHSGSLHILRLDGTEEREVPGARVCPSGQDCFVLGHPAWSPDGTTLAAWTGGTTRDDSGLYLIAPDGSGKRRILAASNDLGGESPHWQAVESARVTTTTTTTITPQPISGVTRIPTQKPFKGCVNAERGPNGEVYVVDSVRPGVSDLLRRYDSLGRKLWETFLPGEACNKPAVGPDGSVYHLLAVDSGTLLSAVDPTGAVRTLRTFTSAEAIYDVAIGSDGLLYLNGTKGPHCAGAIDPTGRIADQRLTNFACDSGLLETRPSAAVFVRYDGHAAWLRYSETVGVAIPNPSPDFSFGYDIDDQANVFTYNRGDGNAGDSCSRAKLSMRNALTDTTWTQPVTALVTATESCRVLRVVALGRGRSALLTADSSGASITWVTSNGRPETTRALDPRSHVQSINVTADGNGAVISVATVVRDCPTVLQPNRTCGDVVARKLNSDGQGEASGIIVGAPSLEVLNPSHPQRPHDVLDGDGFVGVETSAGDEFANSPGTVTELSLFLLPVARESWRNPPVATGPIPPTTTTTIPVSSGTLRIAPPEAVQGTTFSLSYSCPARTIPNIRITNSSNQPVVQGFSFGLRTVKNGRDYNQTLTAYNPGVYTLSLFCNNTPAGSARLTVTAIERGVGKYVALGDSFSSGEGTYSYDSNALRCHRGKAAWPRQLEADANQLGPIQHRACTGATTRDLLAPQKGKRVPAQIPNTPQPDVGLVTLTIGGNDAGFRNILMECVLPGSCADAPDRSDFLVKLVALTETLKRVVYPRLERAYPNARIVHVGYPRLTPLRGSTPINCMWLDPDEQDAGAKLADRINGAIRSAVRGQSRIEYADVTNALQGSELCTADSWVHEITPLFALAELTEQGHPDARGQNAYEMAVAKELGLRLF